MAIYDTAGDVVNNAAIACGLPAASVPFSSTDQHILQMCNLLNRCGRELLVVFQWQQFVKTHSFNTGSPPPTDGEFALPADFGWMINQTGWTPSSGGMGLPLGGPLTEQLWQMIVASGLGQGTIYASFKVTEGVMKFITPVPADQEVTFAYASQGWVDVGGAGTTFETKATADDDVILYDSELITTMLELRFKQAKGLDSTSAADAFATKFASYTGINSPAPIVSCAYVPRFPYLSVFNVPQSGFGS